MYNVFLNEKKEKEKLAHEEKEKREKSYQQKKSKFFAKEKSFFLNLKLITKKE